jgi:hypothetical protein
VKKEGIDPNPLEVKKEGNGREDDNEQRGGMELWTCGDAGARLGQLHDHDHGRRRWRSKAGHSGCGVSSWRKRTVT